MPTMHATFSSLLVIQPARLLAAAEGVDSIMVPVTSGQESVDDPLEG